MFEPDTRLYVQPLDDGNENELLVGAASLSFDAYLADGTLKIEIDVPGAPFGRVRLRVEDHVLVAEADRQLTAGARIDPLITGRSHGTPRRRLLLGAQCDVDHIEATLANGVLSVTVQMKSSRPATHVAVRDGDVLGEPRIPLGVGRMLRDAESVTSAA